MIIDYSIDDFLSIFVTQLLLSFVCDWWLIVAEVACFLNKTIDFIFSLSYMNLTKLTQKRDLLVRNEIRVTI